MEVRNLSNLLDLTIKKIHKTGFEKFVVAASGGVDSTLLLYVMNKLYRSVNLNP